MNMSTTGIIYKLVLSDGREYVGSTTQTLAKRMGSHRANPGPRLREAIATGCTYTVEVLEQAERVTKAELRTLEQRYKDQLSPAINIRAANAFPDNDHHYSEGNGYARAYASRPYYCEKCGTHMRYSNKSRHQKTTKHMIKNIN